MRALTELKKICFDLLEQYRCYCCLENKPRHLLLHHLIYNTDSVVYNQFENSDYGRLKYYANLIDEIKLYPNNFLVVCFNCHGVLEDILKNDYDTIRVIFKDDPSLKDKFLGACKLTLDMRKNYTAFDEATYDVISPPNFIKNLGDVKTIDEAKQFLEKIERNELSLTDYSYTAELAYDLDKYIDTNYYHLIAAIELSVIRDIKEGDKIFYVRTINEPNVKPIEFARKEEINLKLYRELAVFRFVKILNINENQLDGGLDEFFWS